MSRKGNPSALLVGMETSAATVENTMEFPQNKQRNKQTTTTLKMVFLIDPEIPLLGLYPMNPKMPVRKNICTPMFTTMLFTVAKCWKQPKCPPVDEWVKKLWYIHTVEYYVAIGDYYAKENKPVRDKVHMISLVCRI